MLLVLWVAYALTILYKIQYIIIFECLKTHFD